MLYQIKNLLKRRQRETGYALSIRSLIVPQQARIALIGPSGCGKSTTLDILGLSLAPDTAETFILSAGQKHNVMQLWQRGMLDKLANLRLACMGYVLQSGELLPFLTTGENIVFLARLAGLPDEEALHNGRALALRLGIERLWKAMPASLSVGERQRAAIARALAPQPKIIIADEPTAALDPFHADRVMDAFLECLEHVGSALILATHNAAWARAGGLKEIQFEMQENADGVMAIIDDGGSDL